MTFMFGGGAAAFNQPLGKWNVGKVANMAYMFNGGVCIQSTARRLGRRGGDQHAVDVRVCDGVQPADR
jgi:hypothetical protein